MGNGRVYSIDTMRCVAAFLIVTLHVSVPIPIVSKILPDIARIAVPFFLLCSGFFIYSKEKSKLVKNINKSIVKSFNLLLIAIVSYFVIDCLVWFDVDRIINQFSLFLSWDFWFFNSVPFCPVAWYLSAYIYSLLLIKLIINICSGKSKYFFLISVVTALFGIIYWLITGAYQSFFFSKLIPWEYNCCWIVAYPFVAIGMVIRCYNSYIKTINVKNVLLICGIVLFSITSIIAHFWIKKITGAPIVGTGYISTIFLVLLIFIFLLKNPLWGRNSIWNVIGNKYSMHIYLFHVAINYLLCRILLVRFEFQHYFSFEPIIKLPFSYYWIINSITVFILSIIIAHSIVNKKNERSCTPKTI